MPAFVMSPGIMWLLWMLAYRIRFYQIINKISDADIVDGARDFRLMRKSMVDAIISEMQLLK